MATRKMVRRLQLALGNPDTSSYWGDLKERLVKAKISQAALARETGVAKEQMSRWLRDCNPSPRLKTVYRVEAALARCLDKQRRGVKI